MGIEGLFKVIYDIAPDAINIKKVEDYNDKLLAIDTSLVLYQYVIAIRSKGTDFQTKEGKITTHIHAIISRALMYITNNITPIFVFDGKPPDIKLRTLEGRTLLKQKAQEKLEIIEDEEEKIKLFKRTTTITNGQIKEVIEILKLIGLPYIKAPEEADSQCAYLSKNNIVYGVVSEDMDILTFGAKRLIRKFSTKRKKQGGITEIDLEKVLQSMDITMEQFIELSILLGSDYTPSIRGLGKKRAYNMIKEFGNIENFINSVKFKKGKYSLPENFDYKTAKKYFKEPPVKEVKEDELYWRQPNYIKLFDVLTEDYNFNKNSTNMIINKIKKAHAKYIASYKKVQKGGILYYMKKNNM